MIKRITPFQISFFLKGSTLLTPMASRSGMKMSRTKIATRYKNVEPRFAIKYFVWYPTSSKKMLNGWSGPLKSIFNSLACSSSVAFKF